MAQNYTTARIVFGMIGLAGWILLTLSPLWVLLFGALGAVIGAASAFGGVMLAGAQVILGLALIATAQLGQAQIAIATNTAAILSLMKKDSGTPKEPAQREEPPLRKDPWVKKPMS